MADDCGQPGCSGLSRHRSSGSRGDLASDGTPHVTLAWVGVDGDELVWFSFFDQHKLESLRRDPRITISFHANEHSGEGLHPYLVAKGTARITEGGAMPVMDRLAEA